MADGSLTGVSSPTSGSSSSTRVEHTHILLDPNSFSFRPQGGNFLGREAGGLEDDLDIGPHLQQSLGHLADSFLLPVLADDGFLVFSYKGHHIANELNVVQFPRLGDGEDIVKGRHLFLSPYT